MNNKEKSIIREGLLDSYVIGRDVKITLKKNGKTSAFVRALHQLQPGLRITDRFRDITVTCASPSDAMRLNSIITSVAKNVKPSVSLSPGLSNRTGKISHNSNDTALSRFFKWIGNTVNSGLEYLNNKADSAENAAIVEANAQVAMANAQAAAEEAKSKTLLYSGIGAGVLLLAVALFLALRKK